MKQKFKCVVVLLMVGLIQPVYIHSQELILPVGYPAFTTDQFNEPEEGYFFISPQVFTGNKPGVLVIMDNYGVPVFYRKTKFKTYCFQPYQNGLLAYFEGSILKYIMLDSTYTPVDTMTCMNCDQFDLHEIRILENGNYLLAGKVHRIVDMSTIVEGGDPNASIEDYLIQEFNSEGTLVFEWKTIDHYAITDANDSVDLLTSVIDPTNFNTIEVESDTTLLLSMAHQDEITKIDRRTGEIIWRMGGKNNDFTFINTTRPFTRQHDVRRLPNGNITLYDNGTFSNPPYSRAVEFQIDEQEMTATQVWEYDHGKDLFSTHKGSVQRLPNGNTLVGWGGFGDNPATPAFTEIKPDGSIAIEVSYPEYDGSYRVLKFPWKTSLITTNTDKVNFGLWDGYTHSVYLLKVRNNSDKELELTNYHLHTNAFVINDDIFPITLAPFEEKQINLLYFPDEINSKEVNDVLTINSDINSDTLIQRIAVQVQLTGTKYYNSVSESVYSDVRVFPNPAYEQLTVTVPEGATGLLRLVSVNGSVVYQSRILEKTIVIDISNLEKGTYILEFTDEPSSKSFRKLIGKQ